MNKWIQTAMITAALLLAAASAATGRLMAQEQNKTGFDISFHHVGISVGNLDESIAWYKEKLGFEEVMRMNQGETIQNMKIGHIRRGNIYISPRRSPASRSRARGDHR